MEILDGLRSSEKILDLIRQEISEKRIAPRLSILLVGSRPDSLLYTEIKQKKADFVGIKSELYSFQEEVSEEELITKIKELNKISDGIIVQLPLPKNLNQQKILDSIAPEKDVDGLTSLNLGKTFAGDETFAPATPKGIIRLLNEYSIPILHKNVVIVNHSNLIGRPLAAIFLSKNATVTVCHEFTKDLSEHTKKADILVTAVGKPNLITAEMVKKGAVVVDAGISKVGGKVLGDVDFDSVKEKASYITPVPGGVGPMTVAILLESVLRVSENEKKF